MAATLRAPAPGAIPSARGPLRTMIGIHLRTGWRTIGTWILAIGATMLFTTTAIKGLYDTPAKVRSYADAVQGDALTMLNGRVAGLESIGGIIANEFGFMASFAIPFMAISLVTRMTRRDEEQGRLEAVLAGRIGRGVPLAAAITVAVLAQGAITLVLFVSFADVGVPARDAALYSLAMGALGLVFIGVAALAAQLVEHNRGVYAIGLGSIIAAYLLRGVGDVAWAPLAWVSPLGWQEKTQAFGDQRWWPLVVPVLAFLGLIALAWRTADRRDLGSAMIRPRAAEPTASAFLRTPLGIALRAHRGSMLGWTVATVIVSAVFGSMAQPLIDAIDGNPSLAMAMGAEGITGVDAVLAMTALILALMEAGYAIQAVGVLRAEETSGRLEARLAGDRSRWAWLTTHLGVIAAGTTVVAVLGGAALILSTNLSVGANVAADATVATLSFVPAVLFFAGLSVLVFGAVPRWLPGIWLLYGIGAVFAYLGDTLNLPDAVLAISPFHLIGSPPAEDVGRLPIAALVGLAALFVILGFRAFRVRGIPQG